MFVIEASLPAPAVLDGAALERSLGRLAAFSAPDAFTPFPRLSDLIGRRFRVVLPMASGGAAGGSWIYDAERQQLTLRAQAQTWFYRWGADAERSQAEGYLLANNSAAGGAYAGRTGLGLPVTVSRYVDKGIGIARWIKPGEASASISIDKSIAMTPDLARAATPHLKLVIEGEVIQTNVASAARCATDVAVATADLPVEVSSRVCVISARFDKVYAEDDRSGAMLALAGEQSAEVELHGPIAWRDIPAQASELYYPSRASTLGRAGSATMSCGLTASGGAAECSVVSESPADLGFGDAALRMQRLLRTVADPDPDKAGGRFIVVVKFSEGGVSVEPGRPATRSSR